MSALIFIAIINISCKKVREGDYKMTKSGDVNTTSCLTSTNCITSSNTFDFQNNVKIDYSGETQFYVNNTLWQKNGKNISCKDENTIKLSPGSTESYTISYKGKIIDNKNMEGDFTSINVNFSGGSVTTSTYTGSFQIKRIKK